MNIKVDSQGPTIVARNGGSFFVEPEYAWHWGDLRITIDRRFVTDLATVPWFARWYIGHAGRHQVAAIIHDAVYAHNETQDVLRFASPSPDGDWPKPVKLGRAEADRMFLEAMRELQVPLHQRVVAYWAVRLFGWLYW